MWRVQLCSHSVLTLKVGNSIAILIEKRSLLRRMLLLRRDGVNPEEAASFIPLCNELQEKMFEAGRECRKLSKDLKHNENATDADYLKVIDECVSVNMRQAQLEKEYYEKFKKILSPKKLYRYKRAEGKFAREFMRGGDDRKEENRKK